ncbi:DUF5684 domain-containing protein [Lysinibacter cavernae]|uniref:Membrane-bound ClpP family serine protease n=1 Tax=Lysinibacter cavernae TaxID=1640652 RepID=A0A7X5R092_9MICO|nr:DUF5684 domain-containing protein [Lysinibacter cavernae]NIH53127.1 membrane-bound ClpP family serine protease [Lysinibacter cavernae]
MITDDTSIFTLMQQNSWVSIIVYIVLAIGLWRVFTKAGEPGWAAIIPIVNVYYLLKIGGKAWWWLLLLLIPIVNIILSIVLAISVGRNFEKGGAFSFFLLWLFAPIGYLILGFGSSTYRRVN